MRTLTYKADSHTFVVRWVPGTGQLGQVWSSVCWWYDLGLLDDCDAIELMDLAERMDGQPQRPQ